ncbi:hypothetical protein PTSG_01354 [Salpingoeca rosetta]|uniref:RecA family profile 1 domain-containing protein n=1 Tax=Salpingoeca rosetta (strain ATCC 50818 / BSB-021) TaxID=946362 RepID=F2U038_SALR5|nr:uncharacterized protein PTSG_01354 [Salpingoeca rosetta]EGD80766.1 hypothetical protein PTSG_01354 [Salpingoeca rosetta]|eukprot:XP_004997327.1 hypothetical protein PTSG_01354 [Salpingoeca rosetta]
MSARRPLRRVASLREPVTSFLASKKITTVADVLVLNILELLDLGIAYDEATHLIDACTKAVAPEPQTVLEMLEERKRFLPTTLPTLDRNLAGGLPIGMITEVAGPSGCGKTQFCMMMTSVAAVGVNGHEPGGVLYLDTEGSFSNKRLVAMASQRFPVQLATNEALVDMSKRIQVITTKTSAELLRVLETLDVRIVEMKARLVILDSAASLLRKEYQGNQQERRDVLAREATLLKRWAQTYAIPVLVTNQVTTRFDDNQGGDAFVTAALGNTWAHSVNTRLTVNFAPSDALRFLSVIKSPLVASSSIAYRITDQGLVEDDAPVPAELTRAQTATAVRIEARHRTRQQDGSRGTSAQVHRSVLSAQIN